MSVGVHIRRKIWIYFKTPHRIFVISSRGGQQQFGRVVKSTNVSYLIYSIMKHIQFLVGKLLNETIPPAPIHPLNSLWISNSISTSSASSNTLRFKLPVLTQTHSLMHYIWKYVNFIIWWSFGLRWWWWFVDGASFRLLWKGNGVGNGHGHQHENDWVNGSVHTA